MKLFAWLAVINVNGQEPQYTNDIVVEFKSSNSSIIEQFAQTHNLKFVKNIFDNHAHFKRSNRMRRSPNSKELDLLGSDQNVNWFEHQTVKSRQKRDFVADPSPKIANTNAPKFTPYKGNDPLWDMMWYQNPYYVDDVTGKKRTDLFNDSFKHDMGIVAAWKMGFSGKGVVVSIIDDGIEYTHDDLSKNYDPKASKDINGHDDDPFPHYNGRNAHIAFNDPKEFTGKKTEPRLTENLISYVKEINRHGTRCAGQVAATRDNGVCVPGIAFNANIGGVRMLDGSVTDLVEAESLGLNQQHIDIYSSSWGPDDDGKTMDGPAKLARQAFKNGATSGRGGKGNIFIWASGNGGRSMDNCNCDGYTNSIYTITISSTTEKEEIPWYSEYCVSTLASTYSSGTYEDKKTLSTDLHNMCTKSHTGTSASAPIAAGIIALLLEANSKLGWRDVQHLLVHTSKKNSLKVCRPKDDCIQADDWSKNGVGRWYSGRYGYGLMDAEALIQKGIGWKNVPEQRLYSKKVIRFMRAQENVRMTRKMENNSAMALAHFTITADDMKTNEGGFINLMEHVTVKITTKSNAAIKRGQFRIKLISPMGTTSKVLDTRKYDYSTKRLDEDHFMTVQLWDEKAIGDWTLVVENTNQKNGKYPKIFELDLHIRGTGNDQYDTRRSY